MLLSIDCSIYACGFAVLDGYTVLRSGVIKTRPEDDITVRLLEISRDLKAILECKEYTITKAVIEVKRAFSYHRSSNKGSGNQKDLHKNSEAIGAIRLTLGQWGIIPQEIEATRWKQGRSKKLDQIIAKNYLGRIASADEADACLMGIWWLQRQRP